MGDWFKVSAIASVIILVVVFGYITFKLNEKNDVLGAELQKVKEDYATKDQISPIVFDRIMSCKRVQITKANWNYNSNDIYARDVCAQISKSCFSATINAMEAGNPPTNVFSKGNWDCSMPISKGMLQDETTRGSPSGGLFDSYDVICC